MGGLVQSEFKVKTEQMKVLLPKRSYMFFLHLSLFFLLLAHLPNSFLMLQFLDFFHTFLDLGFTLNVFSSLPSLS